MAENLSSEHISGEKQERYQKISSVLLIILGLNLGVSLVKLVLGTVTNCLSIFADGLHSFGDGASNVLGLFGIRLAGQPRDFDHPYGHRRYETLASLGIGFLLLLVVFHLIGDAYEVFRKPREISITIDSFIVMLMTMAVNIGVTVYEHKKAKELDSDLLKSDAMHTASDVLVTVSIIAGLVLMRLGLKWVDPVTTVIVALVILRAALHILKQSSDVLCDHIVLDAEQVRNVVSGIEGVRDCHMVRSRGRNDDIQVDLHVLVADQTNVKAAHALAHRVEDKIRERFGGVTDVVVHIEPESSVEEGHI